LEAQARARGILLMCAIAVASWFFFAIVPAPYNLIFLFANGFPLGMVWGMVFQYMEGRRMTEILGAALSVSFIFSGGLCRTVGAFLMRDWGVSEFWMPLAASGVFTVPFLLFLWLGENLPPPSALAAAHRTRRHPLTRVERHRAPRPFR